MMRKYIVLSLAALAVLSLSGCETNSGAGKTELDKFQACRKFCQDQGMVTNINITKLTGECRCTDEDTAE